MGPTGAPVGHGRRRAPLSRVRAVALLSLRSTIIAEQEEGSVDSTVEPRTASLFIWAALTGLPDWYRPGTAADAEGVASALVTLGQHVRAS